MVYTGLKKHPADLRKEVEVLPLPCPGFHLNVPAAQRSSYAEKDFRRRSDHKVANQPRLCLSFASCSSVTSSVLPSTLRLSLCTAPVSTIGDCWQMI